MYKTTCPGCNDSDCLYVIAGSFQAVSMPLKSDGFAFSEAKQIDTEEETVRCKSCTRMAPLSDLYVDRPPREKGRHKIKGD
jgi:hypothetical protein